MKLALVLTNDWELFGDGSGDYFEIQDSPSRDMLKLLDEFDFKMTLMAEVGQQWGFQSLSDTNPNAKKVSEAWEKLVKDFYKQGHDVQLHLHTQWLKPKFENQQWILDDKNWSIGKLSKDEKLSALKRGKDYLESILREVNPDYDCNIFRAGAYYIEPSSDVIESLVELGFKADSSVTKGSFVTNYFDFRNANDCLIPWLCKDSVSIKNTNGSLIENPIYSHYSLDSEVIRKFFPKLYYNYKFGKSPQQKELQWAIDRDKIKANRYPVERRTYKKNEVRDLAWYMQKFLSKNPIQLDYDYLPATAFVEIIKKVLDDKRYKKYFDAGIVLPIIASGHIKDAHNNDNLRWILEKIQNELGEQVGSWTMTEAIANFDKINKLSK